MHYHLIGICGTAMASLAGMLQARGHLVTGSDQNVYPPMSTFLAERKIEVISGYAEQNLARKPDLVVIGNALSRGNPEAEFVLDHKLPYCSLPELLKHFFIRGKRSIVVSGTHGKTTTSTMIAYLLRETGYGCNAFLGGISVNYDRNYWSNEKDCAVVEADEYDRSFLKLHPDVAVLTSMDADHLDIYGTVGQMEDAFIQYTKNIKNGGTLLVKKGLYRMSEMGASEIVTYSLQANDADVFATSITQQDGGYAFDVMGKGWSIKDMQLSIGGIHNVENAIAAIAVTQIMGIDKEAVKKALPGFKGVKRRFEYVLKNERIVYIDDYAHHPEELLALIQSAKHMFANRKCVIAFQPHLYSRTRDLADGFAKSLDMADKVILLDIYPARELPINGVTSNIITDKMTKANPVILSKEGLLDYVRNAPLELFITAGAGNIDQLVAPIKEILESK